MESEKNLRRGGVDREYNVEFFILIEIIIYSFLLCIAMSLFTSDNDRACSNSGTGVTGGLS